MIISQSNISFAADDEAARAAAEAFIRFIPCTILQTSTRCPNVIVVVRSGAAKNIWDRCEFQKEYSQTDIVELTLFRINFTSISEALALSIIRFKRPYMLIFWNRLLIALYFGWIDWTQSVIYNFGRFNPNKLKLEFPKLCSYYNLVYLQHHTSIFVSWMLKHINI